MDDLRYPIGKFSFTSANAAQRESFIEDIAKAPADLRTAVTGLSKSQLEMPYREGGWTVRQVVHHVVDSHINSYIRFRWALTEDKSVIKAYDEKLWAELPDAQHAPIELSLSMLDALHARWVYFFRQLKEEDFKKVFVHPESGAEIPLDKNLALYSWHGKHHIAHITGLREREGWS